MKLILVRHGESRANVDRSLYFTLEDHNITLTDKGVAQAKNAGVEVAKRAEGNVEVYISPYARTRATWSHMAESLKVSRVWENPSLREQEHKTYQDAHEYNVTMAFRKAFGKMWFRHENAESIADVADRVMSFLAYIKTKDSKPDTVVIVAHEIVIRMFMYLIEGGQYEDYVDAEILNGGLKVYHV